MQYLLHRSIEPSRFCSSFQVSFYSRKSVHAVLKFYTVIVCHKLYGSDVSHSINKARYWTHAMSHP